MITTYMDLNLNLEELIDYYLPASPTMESILVHVPQVRR